LTGLEGHGSFPKKYRPKITKKEGKLSRNKQTNETPKLQQEILGSFQQLVNALMGLIKYIFVQTLPLSPRGSFLSPEALFCHS
jgi:hypothetical protein